MARQSYRGRTGRGDLESAAGPWASAAYHAQQAAEKLLKAALVESGVAPPRTHDLLDLIDRYPGGQVPVDVETASSNLSLFAWTTRYPGGPVTAERDVAAAEAALATIKAWMLSVISP